MKECYQLGFYLIFSGTLIIKFLYIIQAPLFDSGTLKPEGKVVFVTFAIWAIFENLISFSLVSFIIS